MAYEEVFMAAGEDWSDVVEVSVKEMSAPVCWPRSQAYIIPPRPLVQCSDQHSTVPCVETLSSARCVQMIVGSAAGYMDYFDDMWGHGEWSVNGWGNIQTVWGRRCRSSAHAHLDRSKPSLGFAEKAQELSLMTRPRSELSLICFLLPRCLA